MIDTETKVCNRCRKDFPIGKMAKYGPRAQTTRSHQPLCLECAALKLRAWKYGLPIDVIEEMLARGCESCGATEDLCIDHDHSCCSAKRSCGKCVRGTLCGACNRALAALRDDPVRIANLMAYAMKWE